MYTGPHIIKDGLVFGYDTGYNSSDKQIGSGRFFKGPAHTNLIEDIDQSYTNTDTTNFKGVSGEEIVDIPIVGKRTAKYVDYFNNYPTSGSCCPNLFHYHANDGKIPVEASTSYTYSIIYKHSNNYTHPNFMYRYEYQSDGTYNTEAGFHSTASDRRTNLGNGWYHAWGSFTTQSTTSYVVCYSFLYNYGTVEYRYSVAAVSLVKNVTGQTHFIIPPQLMLEPLGSVSNTASLIDLKETTDIDVSNVSFDSTGQPTFDGTSDYISKTRRQYTTEPWSVEIIFKPTDASDTSWNGLFGGYIGAGGYWFFHSAGNLALYSSAGYLSYRSWTKANTFTVDEFHHLVITYTPATSTTGTFNLYYNGGEKTDSFSFTFANSYTLDSQFIGMGSGNRFGTNDVAVYKEFEKALSATEVKQNFNAYKNRFSI